VAIHEEELPGIGRKYEFLASHGERIDVVIHHSGRRDLYIFESDDDEAKTCLQLTDDQARRLGAVLGGAYFKPALVAEIETLIGEFVVDWATLGADSPAAGRSISDLQIRRQTGMSVIAVVRDGKAVTSPDPTDPLRPGDRLVVVGPRGQLPGFIRFLSK
jgi:TrkA domain protein